VYSTVAGAAIGLAVGLAGRWLRNRVDDPPIEIAGSLLMAYAAPDAADPPIDPAHFDTSSLMRLPQSPRVVWELSVEYSDAAIGEPPRPFWPKLGLSVDGASGHVLGFKLGGPDKTAAQIAAECLVDCLQRTQRRPETIALNSVDLIRAVSPLLKSLKTGVLPAKRLPMTEEARCSFLAFNRRG
jgi:hypothetical protein